MVKPSKPAPRGLIYTPSFFTFHLQKSLGIRKKAVDRYSNEYHNTLKLSKTFYKHFSKQF
nr:MAG TPA: hypothetical protein [Caudoviricetes sp.]